MFTTQRDGTLVELRHDWQNTDTAGTLSVSSDASGGRRVLELSLTTDEAVSLGYQLLAMADTRTFIRPNIIAELEEWGTGFLMVQQFHAEERGARYMVDLVDPDRVTVR